MSDGFVYAISGGPDRVKIGWSRDPLRRLSKIRSDCPDDAQLIGLIAATKTQETAAHALLAPWNIRREWFLLRGLVISFVNSLPAPQMQAISCGFALNTDDKPLRAWRKRQRMPMSELAALLDVSRATVSRYETGDCVPEAATMLRIINVTDRQVLPNDFYDIERVAA